jgi:hypothetical protein
MVIKAWDDGGFGVESVEGNVFSVEELSCCVGWRIMF